MAVNSIAKDEMGTGDSADVGSHERVSELVEIMVGTYPVIIDLAYATSNNFVGRPVYAQARCALRPQAAECLLRAALAARRSGYTIKIFDAYRPAAVQEIFWAACPDPRYVSDVKQGSSHTRGVAVDVTLLDEAGTSLDMGTGFDAMEDRSHHNRTDLPVMVERNRNVLLGIMMHAGFHPIATEWWHYQLPDAHAYPLLDDPIVQAVQG